MKIFLDDQWETDRKSWVPAGYVGVKNFVEFKKLAEDALARDEKIEAISFDNDLGTGEPEGWEIAKWLVEKHPEVFAHNPEIKIHSANPEGRAALEHHLAFGQNNWAELVAAKDRPHPWGEMTRKE
jgi:hypothetical protein